VIRPALPGDTADLAALHALAFPPAEAWSAEAMALMLEMPGSFGLWLPGAGLVLARVAVDEAEILTIAVVPAARRRGLGAALLAAALAGAGLRGAASMFLEVAAENTPALALYAALGFFRVGQRRHYYGQGRDALVMRRGIGDAIIAS
jgi:ribosomal-protein-alanine N-acetyltransferase